MDSGDGPTSDEFNNELDILIQTMWSKLGAEYVEIISAPNFIEIAKLTERLLNIMAESADAAEWFSELRESPKAFGYLIMGQFPLGPDDMPKRHFFDIADEIGPDYAQALYHASVFMTKVA